MKMAGKKRIKKSSMRYISLCYGEKSFQDLQRQKKLYDARKGHKKWEKFFYDKVMGVAKEDGLW